MAPPAAYQFLYFSVFPEVQAVYGGGGRAYSGYTRAPPPLPPTPLPILGDRRFPRPQTDENTATMRLKKGLRLLNDCILMCY